MKRVEAILNMDEYRLAVSKTAEAEEQRIFCIHDANHFWEVARVAMLLYLSGEVECPELAGFSRDAIKEMIYAVAMTHDIGRYLEYQDATKDHAVESAVLARPLFIAAGFSRKERELMEKAIKAHRTKGTKGFDLLIYRADKESRPCISCKVLSQCKKFGPDCMPEIHW